MVSALGLEQVPVTLFCASPVGQKISIFNEHKSYVQGITWDPLGQYIATLSCDRYVSVGQTVLISVSLHIPAELFCHHLAHRSRGPAVVLWVSVSWKECVLLVFPRKENWKLSMAVSHMK